MHHIALNRSHLPGGTIENILKGESDISPSIKGKKGELFSHSRLIKFIKEEAMHDCTDLTSDQGRSIKTLSSGEQKKALLNFILKSDPSFLIIDNPFDALDIESVEQLKERLTAIACKIPIIQMFNRVSDLLPFISKGLTIDDSGLFKLENIDIYLDKLAQREPFKLRGEIPAPLSQYELNNPEIIRFSDVDVSYGDRKILNSIDWVINRGEFWQLKGGNGTGKTTILTMINGDNPKAFGQEIYLFGKRKGSGESVWDLKDKIGYFTPSLMEPLRGRHTARNMVVSGLVDSIGLYSKPSAVALELADRWLKVVGLEDKKNLYFSKLAEVDRRLILIIRAMIKHPPILILDEPSIGLDDYSSTILSTLVNKMAKESDSAILYVSHRTQPGLYPDHTYQLTMTQEGSIGEVM